jgi:hypothetical protein
MNLAAITSGMCAAQRDLQHMAVLEWQGTADGRPASSLSDAIKPVRTNSRNRLAYGALCLKREFRAANDAVIHPEPETA